MTEPLNEPQLGFPAQVIAAGPSPRPLRPHITHRTKWLQAAQRGSAMTGRHEQPQEAIAPLLEIHRSLHISDLPALFDGTGPTDSSTWPKPYARQDLPE